MKTTLKRGMGRVAAANGNGHAVYPPAAVRPMTRYRQPPPTRGTGRLIARIAGWTLGVFPMLVVGLAGGSYLYADREIVQALNANAPDLKLAAESLDAVVPGEPVIALVVGSDKRAGAEGVVTGNSDTLMLVRADPHLDAISMLSFPRDLIVDVRCGNQPIVRDRINSAYSRCGAQGALDTVRGLTRLPINYLVTVDFRGFMQIVASLGGVWMDVDRRYFNDRSGPSGYAKIDLKPGYQKLGGVDALSYVRYRHADSDIYRHTRQQLFLKALKQRMETFPARDLPRLIKVVTKHVEVGKADATAWNPRVVAGLALFAYHLPAGHFFQSRIDPGRLVGQFELTADEATIEAAIQDFVHPDVEAPQKATDVALGTNPEAAAPAPSATSVTVLNGNGRAGSAASASSQLAARGYRTLSPPNGADANAPSFEYYASKVYYDPSQRRSEAAAEKIAKLLGEADVEPLPTEIRPLANAAMTVVVVGQTFSGRITAPVDRTPRRQPPYVRTDPSEALALVRAARGRVGFPLMYPTVIERTSFPESQMPARAYGLEGHGAFRLTFSTGASEYWGIQQTNWEDAPALSAPSTTRRIGGREYQLYYSGAHLHMVVLRENGATYWVVNTLLDSLSNETMLAIAKGLRPLKG